MNPCPPLSERLSQALREPLAAFNLERLEAETHTIYGIDRDGRLAYLSPAWFAFAHGNGGSSTLSRYGIGQSVVAAMLSPLRERFEAALDSAWATGQPVEYQYLCPSPSLERVFRLRVLPLSPRGWLIHNALVVEQPHSDVAKPLGPQYVGARGLIVQCSSCRRVRHGQDANRWDWVPELVQSPHTNISHGFCEPCLGFYFPPTIAFDSPTVKHP